MESTRVTISPFGTVLSASGTVMSTPSDTTSLAWLAAPVLLASLILAIMCCLSVCAIVRRLNRNNVRVRPQLTDFHYYDANLDIDIGESPVVTEVGNHTNLECQYEERNGTFGQNGQISSHLDGAADQKILPDGETVFDGQEESRPQEMAVSLEEKSVLLNKDYDSHSSQQSFSSKGLPSIPSDSHSQDQGSSSIEGESELSPIHTLHSSTPSPLQDVIKNNWTFDAVQDMAALSQYTSQGDHDVFVIREKSRKPMVLHLPPPPPIQEYHIGRGRHKHDSYEASQTLF